MILAVGGAGVPQSSEPSLDAPDTAPVWVASTRAELSALAYMNRPQPVAVAEPPRAQLATIAARTRITAQPSEAGATSLHVKMWTGFQPGARLRINPGGATEEDTVLLNPTSFTLVKPLQYMHGLGETVLELGGGGPIESSTAQPPQPPRTLVDVPMHPGWAWSAPPVQQPAAAVPGPAPPQPRTPRQAPREPPLVGSVAQLLRRASMYVHGHWGVEAAVALLGVLLAALCMAGYLVRVFFEYSLCCFYRQKTTPATANCFWGRPRSELKIADQGGAKFWDAR